ncbi:MAG: hypothetical protein KBC84_01790 [Proteobacteria bacterium]|nr:hypothetical protein [Pseudomonadota bacterium]
MIFIINILTIITSIFGQFALGLTIERLVYSLFKRKSNPTLTAQRISFLYILGLLVYLLLILFLTSFVNDLKIVTILVTALGLFFINPKFLENISLEIKPSFNLSFWFLIICLSGISIFSAVEDIKTPWVNNYGDLTWHLGMISNFTFGQNFPPHNHLYPPSELSYPFLINLWSATLWIFNPNYSYLSLVFALQWIILWTVVYFSLNGDRYRILPWIALFGGGAFKLAYVNIALIYQNQFNGAVGYLYNSEMIGKGYVWTDFFTTIWVTQRTAVFGAAVFLVLLNYLLENLQQESSNKKVILALSALMLSLGMLAHTHFFVVTAIFISLLLFFWFLQKKIKFTDLLVFVIFLSPLALQAHFVLGKKSIVSLSAGWMQRAMFLNGKYLEGLENVIVLWKDNVLVQAGLIIFILLTARQYLKISLLLLLFILGNIVQVAIWEWDQIKIFIMIYLLALAIIANSKSRKVYLLHYLTVVFLLPSLVEFYVIFAKAGNFTVYERKNILFAKQIRDETGSRAVIASAPDHNSLLTLAGRRMYLGYEGTLFTHGVDYQGTKIILNDLDKVVKCKVDQNDYCPDYLVWTDREKAFWKRDLDLSLVTPTELPFLFKINDR